MTTRLFTLHLDYAGSTQPQAIYGTDEFALRIVGLDHHRAAPSKPNLTLKNPEGVTVATMDIWATDWTENVALKRPKSVTPPIGSRRSTHHFDNEAEAIQYRADHGTGGWIFVCTDKGEATIFPWNMTPSDILKTGMTSQSGGRFIGATGKITKAEDLA